MNDERIEKCRRYLVEALKLSYGCPSSMCLMGEKNVGTAKMCNCGNAFKIMVDAVHQIVEEEM